MADVELKQSFYEKVGRLLRAAKKAETNSPYVLPERSDVTVTVSATTDTTLGAVVPLATGGIMTAAAGKFLWVGGVPTVIANLFIGMPVVSNLPANGNLASLMGAGSPALTIDQSMYNHGAEMMSDGDTIELGIYCNLNRKVMFQVDGQYVSKAGHLGVSSSNAVNYFKLAFGSRKPRRIRILMSNRSEVADAPTMLTSLRMSALSTFWKPDVSDVLKLGCYTDSYGMGGGGTNVFDTPNATFTTLMGELLGFRDTRQLSQFGTGYLATGTGRAKLSDQIPRSITSQGPWDAILVAHGYNDSAQTPAAITAEALVDFALIRASSSAPIVVLGPHAGATGPSAAIIATENAIAAAVTAFADPLCKFAPNSTGDQSIISGTGYAGTTNGSGNSDIYIQADHIHPNGPPGHEFIAYRGAGRFRDALQQMAA